LVFPSEEREREREIQTGRSKPKASRYEETRGEEIHPQYHLTSHTTTQQARKNTIRRRRRRRRRRSLQNHLPKSPKLQPKIQLKTSLERPNL
jgi:hypothetical protein